MTAQATVAPTPLQPLDPSVLDPSVEPAPVGEREAPADAPADAAGVAAPDLSNWPELVAPYRVSHTQRSLFQLFTTWGGTLAVWGAAYWAMSVSIWLTLAIDVVLAGFFVRLFIIQHDCGHGSFFTTARANRITGVLSSIVMLTPYGPWRRSHAIHHATTGDLDRRGMGDVYTMTVAEYEAAKWWEKIGYRLLRNPLVLLGLGPIGAFAIAHRIPGLFPEPKSAGVRRSVHLTTLASVALIAAIFVFAGWESFLLIHLPAGYLAMSCGIFLFYVQHQFTDVYWRRNKDWDFVDACMLGSSHLKLNPVLAYFSGDIGVHHLHHLAPGVPNYALRACLAKNPEFKAGSSLTLWQGLATLNNKLYDEEQQTMVGWPKR